MSILAQAERIRRLTATSSPIEIVDRPIDDPAQRRPDDILARRALGWRPLVGCDDGLGRTINWFDAHLQAA